MDGNFNIKDAETPSDSSSPGYMLLSDTTGECAPQHLLQLMEHYDVSSLTQAHILFLCVYVMTLEEGYIPNELHAQYPDEFFTISPAAAFNKENVRLCCSHKPKYKSDEPNATFFEQNFTLNVPVSSETPEKCGISLTALVTGEFMIITLRPNKLEFEGKSVVLSITRYAISRPQSNKPIAQCFRKLDQLRTLLREELYVPIRNMQCELVAAEPYPGMMGLPQELRFKIYNNLSNADLRRMAVVCRDIKEEVSHQKKKLELKKKQNTTQ